MLKRLTDVQCLIKEQHTYVLTRVSTHHMTCFNYVTTHVGSFSVAYLPIALHHKCGNWTFVTCSYEHKHWSAPTNSLLDKIHKSELVLTVKTVQNPTPALPTLYGTNRPMSNVSINYYYKDDFWKLKFYSLPILTITYYSTNGCCNILM